VFRVDPATGQGILLTNGDDVPGANGVRISTSEGQAVWPFQSEVDGPYALHFYDGAAVQTLEPDIVGNPHISRGRIVYLRQVAGVDQVFLYDTRFPVPEAIQVSTDADGVNAHPRTDGHHVAWLHTGPGASGTDIMLAGGLTVNAEDERLPNQPGDFREHPFQLNRGQFLWRDMNGRLMLHSAGRSRALDISPATTYGGATSVGSGCCTPWLSDGWVAITGLSIDGGTDREVFLLAVDAPLEAQPPPPLVVQAEAANQDLSLRWDAVIGATSYNLYIAYDPAITSDNIFTLAGGQRVLDAAAPFLLGARTNRIHFVAVSVVEGGIEGPTSAPVTVALWAPAAGAAAGSYFSVATGRTNGPVAYAAGGSAVYRSTDAGGNWTPLAGGIEGLDVRALAVDGPRVYAATRDVFGMGPARILRSLNAGDSWTEAVADGGSLGESSKMLAVDPGNPARLYAANFQLPSMIEPDDAFIIVSPDGGESWNHLAEAAEPLGAEIRAHALAIDPSDTSILYAGGSGTPNLVRSADGGATWTDVSPGNAFIRAIVIDPEQPHIVYAGAEDFSQITLGVFKSSNSGADWTPMTAGFRMPLPRINTLLIDPANPSQIHAGTDQGHYLTLDGGIYWTRVDYGLRTLDAEAINAFALTETRQLLAATSAGVHRLDLSTLNLAVPTLTLSRSGSDVLVSWPAVAGFSLQVLDGFQPGAIWSPSPGGIDVANGTNTVVVTTQTGARFFRLRMP
jgi:hypothetical protein